MTRRCRWCKGWILLPLLLLLGGLGTIAGCTSIQSDLSNKSSAALSAAGVAGVAVDFDYRNGTLSGPESARNAALAAVAGLNGPRAFTYVGTGDSASATSIAVEANYDGAKLVLSGEVASESQKATLVAAANETFGADNVDDQISVASGGNPSSLDAAVDGLAAAIGGFKGTVTDARANLSDTTLTVTGRMRTTATGSQLGSLLDSLQGPGLTVTRNLKAPGTAATPPAASAPKAAEQKLREILRISGINFGSGSASIETASYPVLDRVFAVLKPVTAANPNARIRIEGHTDAQGVAASNLALSSQRAAAVKAYLVRKGVARNRMVSRGFGDTRPRATNATEAGRRTNRRIEFKVGG